MKHVIFENSIDEQIWHSNESGVLHREDGPAREFKNGRKEWWVDGKRHRADGPAVEFKNGHKEWWIDDKLHREDGPAIEYSDGGKAWFKHGKRHREDGPAIIYSYEKRYYCLYGIVYSEEDYWKEIIKIKFGNFV